MLVGYIFVCYMRGDIKYNDGVLFLNVIFIFEFVKFFLFGSILYVENDFIMSCVEF